MVQIQVQAVTVDYDEDHPGDPNYAVEAVSGSATLGNILIKPVADEVTLAINGRAYGREDTEIPLSIRPTSSDPSETTFD
ncbi:hypothetical protein, partial [Klebsiella pneumoniae]|uniref:hypothetical protein n=1 Tax=Klebsiella pneumoniae TaxID=573 RepID=UPI00272F57A1